MGQSMYDREISPSSGFEMGVNAVCTFKIVGKYDLLTMGVLLTIFFLSTKTKRN